MGFSMISAKVRPPTGVQGESFHDKQASEQLYCQLQVLSMPRSASQLGLLKWLLLRGGHFTFGFAGNVKLCFCSSLQDYASYQPVSLLSIISGYDCIVLFVHTSD